MYLTGSTVRELLARYLQGQLKPKPPSGDRQVQPAEAFCFPEWEGY